MNDTQKLQKTEEDKDRFEYLKYCYGKMDDLRTSIYQRASILVVVMSFIILAWNYIIDRMPNISNEVIAWKIILGLACFTFLITFSFTAYYGLKCLMPIKRDKTEQFKNTVKYAESLNTEKKDILMKDMLIKDIIFTVFDYICNLKKHDFEKVVQELDLKQINEQLISAIHGLSLVIEQRYNNFHTTCKLLLINIIIFVILSMLELFRNFF